MSRDGYSASSDVLLGAVSHFGSSRHGAPPYGDSSPPPSIDDRAGRVAHYTDFLRASCCWRCSCGLSPRLIAFAVFFVFPLSLPFALSPMNVLHTVQLTPAKSLGALLHAASRLRPAYKFRLSWTRIAPRPTSVSACSSKGQRSFKRWSARSRWAPHTGPAHEARHWLRRFPSLRGVLPAVGQLDGDR